MAINEQTYRRATAAALIGLLTQLVLAVVMALLGLYARSAAIHAATWHLIGGLPIWITLWVLYNQHRHERIEALEADQLAEHDAAAAALFQEAGDQLALARRRLEKLYRFGLNIVALLVAVYLVAVGGVLFYAGRAGLSNPSSVTEPLRDDANLVLALFLLPVSGFVAFLVARYVAGMTEVGQWQALRAGAAYLMGCALVAVLLLAAAASAYLGNPVGFVILAAVIPLIMIALGVEILLTFVLGIYRPRKPGQFVRPAFDSRVLGWLTRPESLGKVISDTVNYQFGFEISRSWFYYLLSQATVPLVLVCGAVVVATSSMVFVAPDQKAVITRFGQYRGIVDPGLHVEWPWPVGRAEKFAVERVHHVTLGSRVGRALPDAAILWTTPHTTDGGEEYLVTAPAVIADSQATTEIAAGELAGADVVVSYRIADLQRYATTAYEPDRPLETFPDRRLEAIAERELAAYFATRSIDTLLTTGRMTAGEDLKERIGGALADADLGLEVVFVALTAVHPPQEGDVAAAFHEQIGVLQERQTARQGAEKDAVEALARVAGSREKALAISEAIERYDELRGGLDERQRAVRAAEIEALLDEAGGEAAQLILEARAKRWSGAIDQQARAESFASQLKAYRAAPRYYRARLYLDAIRSPLRDRPKIIIDGDDAQQPPIIRLNREGFDVDFETIEEN